MAAQSNGRAKKPKKSTPNGHMNGHADKSIIPGPVVRTATPSRPKRTMAGSLTSILARLASWYIIVTILFKCPSSLSHLSKTSPQVCKPYLNARSYAAPYLDPYYETYVAPQVDKVKPYVHRFDEQVYSPLATYTKDKYATYGAHRVEQVQQYAEAEWARSVRPQLQSTQAKVKGAYDLHLAPHLQKASDLVAPYYDQTKDSLIEIYHLSILPTFEAVQPYAHQGYEHGHHVVSHIIFPHVRSAKDATWKFISRTIWPQVRVLYGDNVEPQLVRIRERLGRYRDQQKVESAVDAMESDPITVHATTESTPTVVSVSMATPKSGWNVLDDFLGGESSSTTTTEVESQTATQPKQPQLTGEELREKLNEDLRNWQSKFATAADKGSEDLEARVDEITKRQIENGVKGHGAALVIQLEETAKSTIATFKNFIRQAVKSLPEDPTEDDLDSAYEKCVAKTRELGLAVKEKAQAVRNWKVAYDQETDSLVQSAVASTVEVLDKIYGLGLQEVGMRWAWTDGVTYNDWKNYHKLRNTLTEWQAEVEAVGSQHEGLRVAHEEANNLEDKAMSIASSMVSELVRLKDVSKWKIWAQDASDDFTDKKVPVRAFKAAQQVAQNAQELSSKASEAVLGSESATTEHMASAVSSSVSGASSKLSEAIIGSETPAVRSVASELKSQASQASSQASEVVEAGESNVSSTVSHLADEIGSVADAAKETIKVPFSAASQGPRKVMGGAMAQVMAEAKQIIFDEVIDDDDEPTYSEKVQSMVADAGDRAAELSRAVSEALLGATKTQGTVESVTSLASEQYERAIAAASSVLYGTQQPAVESATSVASEKFAQAVTAASYAIYGTPTPTAIIKTVQVAASSRFTEAVSLANSQYENAKSQLSALVQGTPKPAHETMLSMIEQAYSDSLAAASERLQAALQYTDSAKSYVAGPTQGYFESVSSIASSRLAAGLSQASAQFSSKPTPALEGARRQYYEAIGMAHAQYSDFLKAASSAVYGPEQGTFESLSSVAAASAASAASQVSSGVIGTETPWAESVASDISGSAKSVASGVSGAANSMASHVSGSGKSAVSRIQEAAESLASQASSTVIGSETPWTESAASQASQNWEALIAKASSQVYGTPVPWTESAYSQAGVYAAQATARATEQYAAVQALISELVVGREPDFTESVMNRFSSAYYTGIPAAMSSVNSYANANYEAASSYAGESYEAATDYAADAYASASSVVSSVFTPPPAVESVLNQASEQINAAVESASRAVYGTTKGTMEQATDSVASAYSSVQSKASAAIYGTQQAQDSFASIAYSAHDAINKAIFGTPTTDYAASVTSGASSVYSSLSSAASEQAAGAASAVSSAVYGPEQGAMESASSRISAAVEAANSRISEMYASASKGVEDTASKASSVADSATQRVKDEL